jgi:hypothetical protein
MLQCVLSCLSYAAVCTVQYTEFVIRDPYIMLLSVGEFRENRNRMLYFRTDLREIIFTCVPVKPYDSKDSMTVKTV